MAAIQEVTKHSVHTLVFRSLKRTHDMFISDQANPPPNDESSDKIKMQAKVRDEYGMVKELVEERQRKHPSGWQGEKRVAGPAKPDMLAIEYNEGDAPPGDVPTKPTAERYTNVGSTKSLVQVGESKMLVPKKAQTIPKPVWHAPWKLSRVISGHGGWVRCLDVEPGNEWFVTGSGDRVIKIWDLASGTLKLSLTGHISTVRGVCVSPRQPYLFSVGEDKQVKCWDLEYNKVTRSYHGHLSACYGVDIHPTLDVIVSCSRDATARVWDMRTKAQIHCFTGHTNTVADVKCQASEPQVITGSHDATIRLWDLAAGKSLVTLTNHKKSVRSVALHPTQYTMASASPDNIKQWKFPDGNFIQNMSGHNTILNALAMNGDNVLVSGGDNGSMYFWDWKSGYNFQRIQTMVQPGSIDSEAGIFAMKFDKSGSRLFTCEADKTIKVYKEDDTASEESHPINWRPDILKKKRY